MPTRARIGWLDPSIHSSNTGDQIIAEAVGGQLRAIFPDAEIVPVPTQTVLTLAERRTVRSLNRLIVGGTNLLNGNIPRYIQWRLDPHSMSLYRGKVALMGVGWWQYQKPSNLLSGSIWRSVLGDAPHSVRDEYTGARLAAMGIRSTTTTCPTMWSLPDRISFAADRPEGVVLTVTDYHKNPNRDRRLIEGLRKSYREVVAWPQGAGDAAYLRLLDPSLDHIGGSLSEVDERFASGRYDYVGTRLHAGIRALQHGVMSVIVAIDNRAAELAADTGLMTMAPALRAEDWQVLESRDDLDLRLPRRAISDWKSAIADWAGS